MHRHNKQNSTPLLSIVALIVHEIAGFFTGRPAPQPHCSLRISWGPPRREAQYRLYSNGAPSLKDIRYGRCACARTSLPEESDIAWIIQAKAVYSSTCFDGGGGGTVTSNDGTLSSSVSPSGSCNVVSTPCSSASLWALCS